MSALSVLAGAALPGFALPSLVNIPTHLKKRWYGTFPHTWVFRSRFVSLKLLFPAVLSELIAERGFSCIVGVRWVGE